MVIFKLFINYFVYFAASYFLYIVLSVSGRFLSAVCFCVVEALYLPSCLPAGGINPLLLNSLFGGMDLSSLQSLQSLQLAAGLMAFPPPTDPKQAAASAAAAASMLPLMLPGMGGLPNMATALPNMFTLGGLFGGNLAAAATSNSTAASGNTNGTAEGEGRESGNSAAKRKREAMEEGDSVEEGKEQGDKEQAEGSGGKKEKEGKEGKEKMVKSAGDVTSAAELPAVDSPAEASCNGDAAALLAAAGMSANSLAFNPFLLSTVAPGLLYPSMFLPPGLGGLSLPGFPAASTLAELQSAMAGMLGGSAMSANPARGGAEGNVHRRAAGGAADDDKKEEDEGGESDYAEEMEEDVGGEGDDSLVEDGGDREEPAASPQKDKSD